MNSVERVADGSLSLHDYPFSPAALDAIALQRVYAALDLTRSRRTLYPSTSSSSWGRLQPSLGDVRAARPPADDRRSFSRRSCFWPSDAGRWSPPGFSSSARKQFVGWRISPRCFRDRSRSCRSGFPSGANVNALRDAGYFHASSTCDPWRYRLPGQWGVLAPSSASPANRSEFGRTTRRRHRPPSRAGSLR